MLKVKTHFEQVPLEIVKKIVEKEVKQEKTAEPAPATRKNELEEDSLEARTVRECAGKPWLLRSTFSTQKPAVASSGLNQRQLLRTPGHVSNK